GGVLDSLNSCKESGPIYDIYHIEKDPELLSVINNKPHVNVEQYIIRKISSGWSGDLLRDQLTKLAIDYVTGVEANRIFNAHVKMLSDAKVPSFQTPLINYLDNKGLDSSNKETRENWYQLSRWYELLLTERPSGSILDRIKQYEAFQREIQPTFQKTIQLAFIRDLYYSMPTNSFYSAKDLHFYSPFLVDLFDKIIDPEISGTKQAKRRIVIEYILEKASEASTVSDLHYLLGDLAIYAQIAQHQQSEINNHSGYVDEAYLFNSSLSATNLNYLNENHSQAFDQQTLQLYQHPIWRVISHIAKAFEQGNLELAINLLGYMVKNNDLSMFPYIDEILMYELEEWIELQLTLEELESV
ncbi:hypothetical protein C1141_12060, partial [Vibrio agarivorans]